MKNRFLIMLSVAALLLPGFRARAADPGTAAAELKDLVTRVVASLQDGKNRTEADQADHLKEFDALLARHKGETNDDVAEIALMKAGLYVTIFKQTDRGTEMLKQLELDFPNTLTAAKAEKAIANIKDGEAARKMAMEASMANAAPVLPLGTNFPDFDVKDLNGQALSLASYKGKVVMVDFWATWCAPCRAEIPNVVRAYQKFHDKGFEIIGVSLDQEDSRDKLLGFTKSCNMVWPQYYDGKFWQNDLAVKCGVNSIPAAFLLDDTGKIIAEGNSLRGGGLEPAVAQALGLKYDAPPPGTNYEGTLVDNSTFPDFQATDLDGKSLSLANYKGKVVMVDFWATWCPPCRAEAPNIASTYEKYHEKGFEVIGISLDQPGDKDRLVSFIKENKMPWAEYYDGLDGPGKLAEEYGIHMIPTAFLIDGNGKIIAQGSALRGEALEPAVKKALGSN